MTLRSSKEATGLTPEEVTNPEKIPLLVCGRVMIDFTLEELNNPENVPLERKKEVIDQYLDPELVKKTKEWINQLPLWKKQYIDQRHGHRRPKTQEEVERYVELIFCRIVYATLLGRDNLMDLP